jgi:copper chaperone CopZ
MKNLWLVVLLAVPLGCADKKETPKPTDSNSTSAAVVPGKSTIDEDSNLTQLVFAVEGMKCSVACPPQVKSALQSVTGVSDVVVDYNAKQARVQVDPSKFDQTAAVQALSAAGFQGSLN